MYHIQIVMKPLTKILRDMGGSETRGGGGGGQRHEGGSETQGGVRDMSVGQRHKGGRVRDMGGGESGYLCWSFA